MFDLLPVFDPMLLCVFARVTLFASLNKLPLPFVLFCSVPTACLLLALPWPKWLHFFPPLHHLLWARMQGRRSHAVFLPASPYCQTPFWFILSPHSSSPSLFPVVTLLLHPHSPSAPPWCIHHQWTVTGDSPPSPPAMESWTWMWYPMPGGFIDNQPVVTRARVSACRQVYWFYSTMFTAVSESWSCWMNLKTGYFIRVWEAYHRMFLYSEALRLLWSRL